jgi:hypothetical protein
MFTYLYLVLLQFYIYLLFICMSRERHPLNILFPLLLFELTFTYLYLELGILIVGHVCCLISFSESRLYDLFICCVIFAMNSFRDWHLLSRIASF